MPIELNDEQQALLEDDRRVTAFVKWMLRVNNPYAARLRELLGVNRTSKSSPEEIDNVRRYVRMLSADQSTLVRLINAYRHAGEPQ